MRVLGLIALVTLSIILQGTLIEIVQFNGVKPDLLLIIVIFMALMKGILPGVQIGFLVGVIEDLVTGKYLGINTLSKVFTGFLIGLVEPKIYKENMLVPVVTLFFATLLHQFLYVFFGNLVGMSLPWGISWKYVILPLAIYHAIIAPLCYLLYLKISNIKWSKKERGRGQEG